MIGTLQVENLGLSTKLQAAEDFNDTFNNELKTFRAEQADEIADLKRAQREHMLAIDGHKHTIRDLESEIRAQGDTIQNQGIHIQDDAAHMSGLTNDLNIAEDGLLNVTKERDSKI